MSTSVQRAVVPDKGEAIFEAALALFVERGFYGTTVPDVAKRAKVAAGTIYHYFSSKEALVNAVFRRWKQALAQEVYTKFPAMAGPEEQFSTMWVTMARWALEHPTAFAFLEFHHHQSYLDDESRALEMSLKTFAAGVVRAAQDAGVFKQMDTMLLMELMFGAFVGMMRATYEGRVDLTEEALEAARKACWDAVAR